MSDLNPEVVIDGQRAVRTATPDAVTQKNDKIAFSIVDGQLCLIVSDINGGGGGGDVLRYKGSVATYSDLPNDAETGDVYNVLSDGKNYAWTGTEWDDFGGSVTVALSACTDVSITNPSNGEALIYNSTNQKWENGSGGFLYNTSSSTNALGVGTSSSASGNSTAVGASANANGGAGGNTAIGYGASATEGADVAIGSSAVAKNGGVAIGSDAKNVYGNGSTVIGSSAQASSGSSVVVGNNATASGGVTIGSGAASQYTSIAIGNEAQANDTGAIQIGAYGVNNTANTMNVALAYNLNVQLLDNTGKIPVDRYNTFTGTDGVNAGTKGCVPAPTASDANKFLKSDGTWASAGGGGSVTLNDIASAGTNITFTTTGVNNVTIQGSPTVTGNVLSNFSDSNYAIGTHSVTSGPFAWKASIKFKTGSLTPARQRIMSHGDVFMMSIDNGYLAFEVWGAGFSWYVSSISVSPDTTYFMEIEYDGDTTYTYRYKNENDLNWTDLRTETGTFSTGYEETDNQIYLGRVFNLSDTGKYFSGSIDLTETYFEINGIKDWNGIIAGVTEISAPDALTNLATGSHALSVGSISQANTGWAITTYGDSCRPSGSALTLIGYKAEAYNGPSAAVVVGTDSKAKATGSIHLGCYGENNTAGTFSVSLSTDGNWQNTHNYTMCDANGYIPGARMSIQAAGAPTTSTAGTVGQFYVDTTNQDAYICVDDTSSTYTWKKITP